MKVFGLIKKSYVLIYNYKPKTKMRCPREATKSNLERNTKRADLIISLSLPCQAMPYIY